MQRRALARSRLLNQSGDATQFSLHARRHDDGAPWPVATLVPLNSMFSRSPNGSLLVQRRRGLLHRIGFTRKRGLDTAQGSRLQQTRVGGHKVAGFDLKDVSDDHLGGRYGEDLPSRRIRACGAVILLNAAMDFSALNSW